MRNLQDIVAAAGKLRGEAVLGTVVDVFGSSYRKPGARVLIRADGSRVGMVSGGCLEKDVVRHAFAWTEEGPRVVLYDTRGDQLHPGGEYGTGCDGLVYLLLERVAAGGPLDVIREAWRSSVPVVMATIYEGTGRFGSAVGARATVPGRDEMPPEIGGVLAPVLASASSWSRPRSVRLRAGGEEIAVLVEPIAAPPDLIVFGAGDDAQPLVRIGAELGWRVSVADRWPALATRSRFPAAEHVVCSGTDSLVEKLVALGVLGPRSRAVLATHSLSDDETLLPALFATPVPWIGLLGPRRRTARLMQQLAAAGSLPTPADLERLETPVGLDLGGDDPADVALSIVAAAVASVHGREGGLMQRSSGPIHLPHDRIDLRTFAVILAAGESRRFGGPKLVEGVATESLVARAVRVAREAGCVPLLVLGAHAEVVADAVDDKVATVVNERWADGMGSSIAAGVAAAKDAGAVEVLVMPADLPELTAASVRKLVDARGDAAASAVDHGGQPGAPACFGAQCFEALLALNGDQGARTLLRSQTFDVVSVALDEATRDVDTAGDLDALRSNS